MNCRKLYNINFSGSNLSDILKNKIAAQSFLLNEGLLGNTMVLKIFKKIAN